MSRRRMTFNGTGRVVFGAAAALLAPALAATATAATVLVTGTNSDKVMSFDVTGKTWTLNGTFADATTNLGGGAALDAPAPLALAGSNVYVAEQKAGGRILQFTTGGAFVGVVATEGVNFTGNPDAMTVGPDGNVYMSVAFGTSSDKIYKLNTATNALTTFVDATGTSPAGSYAFNNPRGIAFDDDGVLYVADRNANNGSATINPVRKFDSAGVFLGNLTNFNTPQSVSYDAVNDRLLITSNASNGNGLVLGYRADGTALGEVNRWTGGNGFLDVEQIGGEVFFTHFSTDAVRAVDSATGSTSVASGADLDGASHMLVVPEPGGLSILALGAVAGLARRRRVDLVE